MQVAGTDRETRRRRLVVAGMLLLQFLLFQLAYTGLFPNRHGYLGEDYGYFLPALLNGYFWLVTNGPLVLPWFSPALCGGIPFLPNPQNLYLSVPQVLTLAVDPLSAAYITFSAFAVLAFGGFFLLCRRCFALALWPSLFAAGLFMLNGFYAHRMLVGHLTYHSYALIPLIAFFLLQRSDAAAMLRAREVLNAVIAALLIAYVLLAGGANFVIPILVAVIGIWAVHRLAGPHRTAFWRLFAGAVTLAACLTAFRMYPAVSYIGNFPRDFYTFAGLETFAASFSYVWRSLLLGAALDPALFISPAVATLRNAGQYSITPAGIGVFAAALAAVIVHRLRAGGAPIIDPRRLLQPALGVLVCILMLPVALNTHDPEWSRLLKSVPYIRNNYVLLRWIAIDIPLVILVITITLNAVRHPRLRGTLAVAGLVAANVFVLAADRSAYHEHTYDPRPVTAAWNAVHDGAQIPPVTAVEPQRNEAGNLVIHASANNGLARGVSPYPCYEAIFGYALEHFPLAPLRPGPMVQEVDGLLNVKNPVCFVFGAANGCRPGDHFTVQDAGEARAFLHYRPLEFNRPPLLRTAMVLSACSLVLVIAFFAWFALRHGRRHR